MKKKDDIKFIHININTFVCDLDGVSFTVEIDNKKYVVNMSHETLATIFKMLIYMLYYKFE